MHDCTAAGEVSQHFLFVAPRAELTDLDSPAVLTGAGSIHHHEAQCFAGLRYKDGYRERARAVAAPRAKGVSVDEGGADAA